MRTLLVIAVAVAASVAAASYAADGSRIVPPLQGYSSGDAPGRAYT